MTSQYLSTILIVLTGAVALSNYISSNWILFQYVLIIAKYMCMHILSILLSLYRSLRSSSTIHFFPPSLPTLILASHCPEVDCRWTLTYTYKIKIPRPQKNKKPHKKNPLTKNNKNYK